MCVRASSEPEILSYDEITKREGSAMIKLYIAPIVIVLIWVAFVALGVAAQLI